MGISPMFCAVIRVKKNWLQICNLNICRIVACPCVDVGELYILLGPLEQELCSIFFRNFKTSSTLDYFNLTYPTTSRTNVLSPCPIRTLTVHHITRLQYRCNHNPTDHIKLLWSILDRHQRQYIRIWIDLLCRHKLLHSLRCSIILQISLRHLFPH